MSIVCQLASLMYIGVPTARRTVEPESPDQTEKAPSPRAGSGRVWSIGVIFLVGLVVVDVVAVVNLDVVVVAVFVCCYAACFYVDFLFSLCFFGGVFFVSFFFRGAGLFFLALVFWGMSVWVYMCFLYRRPKWGLS